MWLLEELRILNPTAWDTDKHFHQCLTVRDRTNRSFNEATTAGCHLGRGDQRSSYKQRLRCHHLHSSETPLPTILQPVQPGSTRYLGSHHGLKWLAQPPLLTTSAASSRTITTSTSLLCYAAAFSSLLASSHATHASYPADD